MAFITVSATAVLRRSRRAGSRPERRDGLGDALHRGPLVADGALDREGEERLDGGSSAARRAGAGTSSRVTGTSGRASDHAPSPAPAERRRVTSVMSSSCSTPGPVNAWQLVEHAVEERAAGVVGGHRLAQAREAVHLAAGAVLLDEAVGVEEHRPRRR